MTVEGKKVSGRPLFTFGMMTIHRVDKTKKHISGKENKKRLKNASHAFRIYTYLYDMRNGLRCI